MSVNKTYLDSIGYIVCNSHFNLYKVVLVVRYWLISRQELWSLLLDVLIFLLIVLHAYSAINDHLNCSIFDVSSSLQNNKQTKITNIQTKQIKIKYSLFYLHDLFVAVFNIRLQMWIREIEENNTVIIKVYWCWNNSAWVLRKIILNFSCRCKCC